MPVTQLKNQRGKLSRDDTSKINPSPVRLPPRQTNDLQGFRAEACPKKTGQPVYALLIYFSNQCNTTNTWHESELTYVVKFSLL